MGLDTKPVLNILFTWECFTVCSFTVALLLLCSKLKEKSNCYTTDGTTDINFITYKSLSKTCEEVHSSITPEILYVKTGYKRMLKNE